MLSPVGRTADTRELPWEMLTCACGVRPGVLERAEGFLERSTIVATGSGGVFTLTVTVDYVAIEMIEAVGRSRITDDNSSRGRGIKARRGVGSAVTVTVTVTLSAVVSGLTPCIICLLPVGC
jgi:hypothetical protein